MSDFLLYERASGYFTAALANRGHHIVYRANETTIVPAAVARNGMADESAPSAAFAGQRNRGALYHLLRNPIYRGMIRHKAMIHPGGHSAIVDPTLFERVKLKLDQAANRLKTEPTPIASASLVGRIFDATGRPMTPTSSSGRHKRMYRYYATNSDRFVEPKSASLQRVPGIAIEHQLKTILERLFPAQVGTASNGQSRLTAKNSGRFSSLMLPAPSCVIAVRLQRWLPPWHRVRANTRTGTAHRRHA